MPTGQYSRWQELPEELDIYRRATQAGILAGARGGNHHIGCPLRPDSIIRVVSRPLPPEWPGSNSMNSPNHPAQKPS